jgi:hydroxymethylbilane synthase
VLPREDPLDAVVLPVRAKGSGLMAEGALSPQPSALTSISSQPSAMTIDDLVAHLGQSPSIGTGSVRRIAQLTRLFPGARFTPIRGNLDTRLRKLDDGASGIGRIDALVLAAAGLRRLGFASRISLPLVADACVPAPGQGIVAVETREDDEGVRLAVERISDRAAEAALTAERTLVEALGGGCQTPVGALATLADGDALELIAVVVALDGSRAVRGRDSAARADAALLGARLARTLLAEGAGDILDDARRAQGAVEGIQP